MHVKRTGIYVLSCWLLRFGNALQVGAGDPDQDDILRMRAPIDKVGGAGTLAS